MKKVLFIMLFILLSVMTSFAQLIKVFYGATGPVTDSSNARFYILKNHISDSVWITKQYSMDNIISIIGTYKDEDLSIPNGFFVYYNKAALSDFPPNSKVKEIAPGIVNYVKTTGEFHDGTKNGSWTEYNSDGSKLFVNTYKNDHLNGLYERYHNHDTVVSVRGNYVNDKREGDWYVLSKHGHVMRKELYKNDKVINTVVVPPHYVSAVLPKGFNNYISRNLSKVVNDNTNGRMFVSFTITKTGKMINPSLSNLGLNSEIADKLLAVISSCPLLWSPPFDTDIKQVIDDNISFIVEIKNGDVMVNYLPGASALYYQLNH